MRDWLSRILSSITGIVVIFCIALAAVLWLITPTGSLGSLRDWFDTATLFVLLFACIPIILGCVAMVRYNRKMRDLIDSPELEKEIHDEIASLANESSAENENK